MSFLNGFVNSEVETMSIEENDVVDDEMVEEKEANNWWAKFGVAGFFFFLAKGLLWLIAPVWLLAN
jgi:hypothetical protein